ncbi:hypothetical protein [Sessilibacter corallicola]|uniref:hypothetical protein n=1 Tax=Sessilibacter corallicola TaxID=2904075 RepID=UPI001E3A1EF5|nr:hypothetical protein [Sessilibacter corallicola]MCE2030359.1 hypothetical protein [Sessilibacter corallicola]
MNKFTGAWTDGHGTNIDITGEWNVLEVRISNGRGPFQGYSVDLSNPTISVNFSDDGAYTGVLGGNTIYWSNGTTWSKR